MKGCCWLSQGLVDVQNQYVVTVLYHHDCVSKHANTSHILHWWQGLVVEGHLSHMWVWGLACAPSAASRAACACCAVRCVVQYASCNHADGLIALLL